MTRSSKPKNFTPDYEGLYSILTPKQKESYKSIGNDDWMLRAPYKKVFDWYAEGWEEKAKEWADKEVEWKHLHLLCEIGHECIINAGLCCPYKRLLSKPLDYKDSFLKEKVAKGEYTPEKRLEIIRNSKEHNKAIPETARELLWMGLVLLTIEDRASSYILYFQLTEKGFNQVKKFGEKGGAFFRWNEVSCLASRTAKIYEEINSERKEPRPVVVTY